MLYLLLDEAETADAINGATAAATTSKEKASKRRGSIAVIESKLASSAYKNLSGSLSGSSGLLKAAMASSNRKQGESEEDALVSLPIEQKCKLFLQRLRALDNLCELYIETDSAPSANNPNEPAIASTSQQQQPIVLLRIQSFIRKNGRQFSNQRMSLTDEKKKIMDYAALMNKIERVQRHRLENQRARYTDRTQSIQLIMDQILRSKAEGFEKQRVVLSPAKLEEMEMNRILKLVEKGQDRKMNNQASHHFSNYIILSSSDAQAYFRYGKVLTSSESMNSAMSKTNSPVAWITQSLHRSAMS